MDKCYMTRVVFYGIFNATVTMDVFFKDLDSALTYKNLIEENWKILVKSGYFDKVLLSAGPNMKHTLKRVEVFRPMTHEVESTHYVNNIKKLVNILKSKED